MNNIWFTVPDGLRGDTYGYEFLAHLAGTTLTLFGETIDLDFSNCVFFEGNLCAVLGNILDSLIARNNKVELLNLTGNVRGALGRNNFLGNYVNNITISEKYHTSIPFRRFQLSDESLAKDFFKKELFGKKEMPQMSSLAQKEIIRNIFEVCLNAVTHGGCDFVYCCGQLYSRKKPAKAIISFADLGNTIKANVNKYLGENLSGCKAIQWALTEGKTTKTGSTPGGLGLKLLQDLITLNNGGLQFISGDGFVEIKEGKQTFSNLNIDFPGTIVTIELLLNDPNFYYLESEPADWNNIF